MNNTTCTHLKIKVFFTGYNTMQPLKLSKERTRNCICIHSTTKAGICKCGWGPFLKKDISVLKRVQRKAAWFCSQNYDRYASVTDMIKDLGWATLETRRRQSRLMLMYKLIHGLIHIDTRKYFIQHSESRTRGTHQFKFRVPYANKDVFSKNYSGLELPP